jgi:hypothetical protein
MMKMEKVKQFILDFWSSQDSLKYHHIGIYPLSVLREEEYKNLSLVVTLPDTLPEGGELSIYYHPEFRELFLGIDKDSEIYKELAKELCYECYLELFHPEELYADYSEENPEPPTPEEEERRVQEMIAMSDRIYEEELSQETGREISIKSCIVYLIMTFLNPEMEWLDFISPYSKKELIDYICIKCKCLEDFRSFVIKCFEVVDPCDTMKTKPDKYKEDFSKGSSLGGEIDDLFELFAEHYC